MENKIVAACIALFVCITLIGSVLIPIIGDSQTNLGDPISLDQSGSRSNITMGEIGPNDEVTIVVGDGTISVNGVTVTDLVAVATWTPFVYTDAGYISVRTSTFAVRMDSFNSGSDAVNTTVPAGTTITIKDGIITTSDPTLPSISFEKGYAYGLNDNLAILIDAGARYEDRSIIKSVNDLIILGTYTTGENDTNYTFINGKLTTVEDYTVGYNADLTLREGTTDIYTLEAFTLDIGGESFTPYYALAPLKIDGHASSGAAYNLLGILPVLVILSLIVIAVGVVIRSKF